MGGFEPPMFLFQLTRLAQSTRLCDTGIKGVSLLPKTLPHETSLSWSYYINYITNFPFAVKLPLMEVRLHRTLFTPATGIDHNCSARETVPDPVVPAVISVPNNVTYPPVSVLPSNTTALEAEAPDIGDNDT